VLVRLERALMSRAGILEKIEELEKLASLQPPTEKMMKISSELASLKPVVGLALTENTYRQLGNRIRSLGIRLHL
jgi:hypothetical protein